MIQVIDCVAELVKDIPYILLVLVASAERITVSVRAPEANGVFCANAADVKVSVFKG